jgi:capsular polysaccharide biosynthesis protein
VAIAVSLTAAAAAEYLNPSLRTAVDVKEFLDLPVLASVSTRGR